MIKAIPCHTILNAGRSLKVRSVIVSCAREHRAYSLMKSDEYAEFVHLVTVMVGFASVSIKTCKVHTELAERRRAKKLCFTEVTRLAVTHEHQLTSQPTLRRVSCSVRSCDPARFSVPKPHSLSTKIDLCR